LKILKKAKKIYQRIRTSMHDSPLLEPTEEDSRLVDELKSTFGKLPHNDLNSDSVAEKNWHGFVGELRRLVNDSDPRDFLRWDVIKKTMFIVNAAYVKPELDYLKNCPDWKNDLCDIVKESPIGHPVPYYLHPDSSENVIHHTYHLVRFQQESNQSIRDAEIIVEFGGGYGNMCRLAHRFGFKGKYIIYDFPEFVAIQTYYLKSQHYPVQDPAKLKDFESGISCVSDIESLDKLLLENISEDCRSLFLATWSISETPMDLRKLILERVKDFQLYLVAYQDSFGEIDNRAFFSQWQQGHSGKLNWYNNPISQLKGNNYLFGWT
jgi:hypothetical protein